VSLDQLSATREEGSLGFDFDAPASIVLLDLLRAYDDSYAGRT
jgi:hypothetical protein